jgi:hypothetical protein
MRDGFLPVGSVMSGEARERGARRGLVAYGAFDRKIRSPRQKPRSSASRVTAAIVTRAHPLTRSSRALLRSCSPCSSRTWGRAVSWRSRTRPASAGIVVSSSPVTCRDPPGMPGPMTAPPRRRARVEDEGVLAAGDHARTPARRGRPTRSTIPEDPSLKGSSEPRPDKPLEMDHVSYIEDHPEACIPRPDGGFWEHSPPAGRHVDSAAASRGGGGPYGCSLLLSAARQGSRCRRLRS